MIRRPVFRVAVLPLVAAVLLLSACDGDEGPPRAMDPVMAFDTAEAHVVTATDTLPLTVELARTSQQRAHGLMEREELPEDAGMLFLYPSAQDSAAAFYMFRTRIPLDIAFLDGDGRILAIRSMDPCPSPNPQTCPRYGPGVPFSSALEMNQGWFQEHGVDVGDRVEWREAPAEGGG